MKSKLFLSFVLAVLLTKAAAQNPAYIDSITIHTENLDAVIRFSNYKYFGLNTLFNDLANLKKQLVVFNNEIRFIVRYNILYYPNNSITIEQNTEAQKIDLKRRFEINYNSKGNSGEKPIMKEVVKQHLFHRHKCKIIADNYEMDLEFYNIEDLDNLYVKQKIEEWFSSIKAKSIPRKVVNTGLKAKIVKNDISQNDSTNLDLMLYISSRWRTELNSSLTVGAALIKNQPLNNINTVISWSFKKNDISIKALYASLRMYPLYTGSKIQYSAFYVFGWRSNIGQKTRKTQWVGFEYGGLLGEESEIFKKNTQVLGFPCQYGRIQISPEFYFKGFFKDVYPGIRFEFGLINPGY